MIYLKDIRNVLSKKNVVWGLIFGVLGLVFAIIPVYGFFLAIICFVISSYFFLFANRLQKDFGADFKDKIKIKDSFSAVLRDGNGKVKTVRKG